MPQAPLSVEQHRKILELCASEPNLTREDMSRRLGIGAGTITKYRNLPLQPPTEKKEVIPDLHTEIRRLLKRQPSTVDELADALDCGPGKVRSALDAMKASGVLLLERHGRLELADPITIEPGKTEVRGSERDEWTHHFGVTTDNHLCNKHARLDVLNAAYDHFEQVGITTVYNCGNWIDGEAKFNKTELLTAPGMDRQLDYLIENFPQRKGITTHYIAGDDHEGWYQQREGVEVGRYLQLRAEQQGRHDLKYLGYAECDVKLKCKDGSAVMRVVHPGGGSAYAISYTDQKRTESYQGGEKPQIELVGHYHKWNHGYPREVHTIQCGCTCDQTLFMRKKRLQAHVGFVEIKIKQDSSGIITRVCAEWFPFFDRGFYEKRF